MSAPPSSRLFIGTSNPRPGEGYGQGIFAAFFSNGQLTSPQLVKAALSPSFLAMQPAAHTLYAVLGGDEVNAIAAAYTTAPDDEAHPQEIKLLSSVDCGSPGGCHIALSGNGRALLVANYTGGSVASFQVSGTGDISLASLIVVPPGSAAPNLHRQESPHPHCALVSPDGSLALVSDLGLDCIHIFRLHSASGTLAPHTPGRWNAAPGAGPRHLLLHPGGTWVYSINELNSTIDQLAWDTASGTLTAVHTVSTVPPGTDTARLQACEIIFSRDHRFLYASNRVRESFAVFSVNSETGNLSWLQEMANPGRESRHIALDPTGTWLLSANQFSADISVFPVDTATGLLSPRTSSVRIEGPSCLLFG